MNIKVTHTRMHTFYTMGVKEGITVPVAEGKLVLIETRTTENFNTTTGKYVPYNPIIISETEKIEAGDWFFAFGGIHQATENTNSGSVWSNTFPHGIYSLIQPLCKKILVLPEQFSPNDLQAIVDGKIKDKVSVECENKRVVYYGDNISKALTSHMEYQIKLNSQGHVTLHKAEERMYTREDVLNILRKFESAIDETGDVLCDSVGKHGCIHGIIDIEEWLSEHNK